MVTVTIFDSELSFFCLIEAAAQAGRSPVPSASLSVLGSFGRSELVSDVSLPMIFGSARP